jgi:phage terminase large subunit-like protein
MAAKKRPRGVTKNAAWDKKRKVWREGIFWFDESAADKAAAFFPDHLRLTTAEWAGQPFVLADWQEIEIIRPLFGWKRENGTRRYRRCYVWVPRKNGKTELAAGIALLMLVGDAEDGGEVYCIASEKDQARIVFDKSTSMVARSPMLGNLLSCFTTSIYCPALNASIKPLSGKPQGKHGFNASGLIGDEIHEWKSGELYLYIHDSSSARRQPLEFLISTAGKKGGYGEEIYDECVKIRDGVQDDPETLVVIYAADPEDDWTDPKIWAKANPNLDKTIKLDRVHADCKQARQLPRLENAFKQFRLNVWTEQAVKWLPIDAVDDEGRRYGWDHCIGPVPWQKLDELMKHKLCFGGLDLSSTNDLSALVWWFPIQDGLEIPVAIARFWKPADLIKAHAKRDKLPYERWVKEQAIVATPGNVVDYAFIQEQIYRDAENFKIAYYGQQKREAHEGGLAIDRYNATETAVKLGQEGLPVVLYGQGFVSMSPPAKELERLVLCNGFHHGGHPVLRRHAQVVAIEEDAAGNIKPAKNKTAERIDGIPAFCNALGIAAKAVVPGPSIYEKPGFFM